MCTLMHTAACGYTCTHLCLSHRVDRTCWARLKSLAKAQFSAQDLPDHPGQEDYRPGLAGFVWVHQAIGRQGEAALCPEACAGVVCGGEERDPSGCRLQQVVGPGLLTDEAEHLVTDTLSSK